MNEVQMLNFSMDAVQVMNRLESRTWHIIQRDSEAIARNAGHARVEEIDVLHAAERAFQFMERNTRETINRMQSESNRT